MMPCPFSPVGRIKCKKYKEDSPLCQETSYKKLRYCGEYRLLLLM
jgi:hypothetical protein